MKPLILLPLISMSSFWLHAQNTDCNEAILATKGNWKEPRVINLASPADALHEKSFLDAVHKTFQPYKPVKVEARPFLTMVSPDNKQQLKTYTYFLEAVEYYCSPNSGELVLGGEHSTSLKISFNEFNKTALYDTSSEYEQTGYFDLRHGLPVEIKPGIWQFPEVDEVVGLNITGKSRLWLITFDGEVPWTYVTRKEFLIKRKRNLLYMLSLQDDHLKEQLEKWEIEKKYKEQELKDDPAKLAKYMNDTYKLGIEREQQVYKQSTQEMQNAIQRVEKQLGEGGMDKQAIVIKSPASTYDYDFTDEAEPFSQVLTKPNPAYFRRKLPLYYPHFISVEMPYDHHNPTCMGFVDSITPLINFDLLKSFIGKPAPGSVPK